MYYRLIAARKKEKKTQLEIAEKLFIHRTTYGLKEAGKMISHCVKQKYYQTIFKFQLRNCLKKFKEV